jgi:cytochrome c peroxidase
LRIFSARGNAAACPTITASYRASRRGISSRTAFLTTVEVPDPTLQSRDEMKYAFRFFVPAVLAGLLAACGGGGASVESPAESPATSSPAGTAPATASAPAVAGVAAVLSINVAALADYQPALPAYYDATVARIDNAPASPGASNAVATLGRVLFYDKQLSVNNKVACASCHQAAFGFSDPNRFSTGFAGNAFTTAHSMRLGNVRYWQPASMFWDRRAATLEAQASQPIQHPVEMGFDASAGGLAALFAKLGALPYYQELFTLAFGDPGINEARLQTALAQFQRAMVSTGSRWDAGYAQVFNPNLADRGLNTPIPGFTAAEDRGRQLFMGGGTNCSACHVPPSFALAANSRSNGLDAGETRLFKSPSLKNVALSGAFMHDGRFATLDDVIDHYDRGVQAGPALDNRLQAGNGTPRRLNLSAADKAALVAFLRTLSDDTLNKDPRFTNPFLVP